MKHYRLLNEGDIIQQGDERWNDESCRWFLCDDKNEACGSWEVIRRRPLGSEMCDHLVGLSHHECAPDIHYQSSSAAPDVKFNFCPLCGMLLTPRGESL